MEVEVDKSRNSLSDRMKGINNGAARIIELVDFREEIVGGGARIRDMKERDVKGGEILGGTNGLKEREKVLVVGISRVVKSLAAILNLLTNSFYLLDSVLALISDNFPPSIPSQPPGGTFRKLSSDAVFVVCSQTFTLFRLRKTAVPAEISQ